jgi:hypothetical protein
MVSHPYSIYIWHPSRSTTGMGHWDEPIQAYTEQWGIYVANLMHQDSHAVIKVVRYGLNILGLPNEHAVELVEQHIAKQENAVKRLDTSRHTMLE